ncbi:MAG: UDP-N-acetyl-D-glucosamine 2-epimerase, UDP-hydrolyzing [Segetibacter sp.]|nr:UDP-N-acetyl-D-glucosamine 2-epimerase, UDP-hydrolyzing [Segetibacter sp.]
MKRKIVFLTGTRADFGKLKSLISILDSSNLFDVHIFATGMHMDLKFGFTVHEIEKCGYKNIYKYINHDHGASMDITLSRTIEGFASFIHLIKPDLIVVHGDRSEALAGAIVGSLNNILVAHIEGGEVSGTVDELIRHAVSKLSHTHFVANDEAKRRLQQMGEKEESVYVIGSPDMDVMLSDTLPTWQEVAANYEVPFNDFAISMFHPVTTEVDNMDEYVENYIKALEESNTNYIVIYPNNDKGSDFILNKLKRLQNNRKFRLFPSVRFEAFLVMMKNALFIAGNSSAGIREAPYYGIPTVNVGTRQKGRTNNPDIIHTGYSKKEVLDGLLKAKSATIEPQFLFGDGKSDEKFFDAVSKNSFWKTTTQKSFFDAVLV